MRGNKRERVKWDKKGEGKDGEGSGSGVHEMEKGGRGEEGVEGIS